MITFAFTHNRLHGIPENIFRNTFSCTQSILKPKSAIRLYGGFRAAVRQIDFCLYRRCSGLHREKAGSKMPTTVRKTTKEPTKVPCQQFNLVWRSNDRFGLNIIGQNPGQHSVSALTIQSTQTIGGKGKPRLLIGICQRPQRGNRQVEDNTTALQSFSCIATDTAFLLAKTWLFSIFLVTCQQIPTDIWTTRA